MKPFVAFLLLLATTTGWAQTPSARVRFAPADDTATAATRDRLDRWIDEAGLRQAPKASRPQGEPAVLRELEHGGVGVHLDGRFAHSVQAASHGGPVCSLATTQPQVATPAAPSPAQVGLRHNEDARIGTADGRLLVYTPDPVEGGSSISHWDRRASPDLLMEPAIASGAGAVRLDLTPAALADMGWPLGTSTMVVVGADPPGLGLNDPRPFAGAPGNPAATLGEARRVVIEAAFEEWAGTLESPVDVEILVHFAELFCLQPFGAILAGAGPLNAFADLAELPRTGAWYPSALAESLAGRDLSGPATITGGGDIAVTVNSFLDEGCLGSERSWYYGLDNQAPAEDFDLYAVLLHELAHGLGMLTLTDPGSGEELLGREAIYDHFLEDLTTGQSWPQLDAEGRAFSARRHGEVVWTGPSANAEAASRLERGRLDLSFEPSSPAGPGRLEPSAPARFGVIPAGDLVAPVACADDGIAPTVDLCSAQVGAGLGGTFVVVDGGGCPVTTKARIAEAAGALGLIVVNPAGDTQVTITATEDTTDITIPVLGVGRTSGLRLRRAACPQHNEPLLAERFAVSAGWFAPNANGTADVTAITPDSVYLTFANPNNVEVVLKVVDACSLADFESFWVFAGGLTDLGVEVRVRDINTGLARRYTNNYGDAFVPLRDTAAFHTCDE